MKVLEVRLLNLLMILKYFCKLSEVQDCENLQKDLVSQQKWTQDWQMQFNIDKCKVMHNPEFNYDE